MADIHQLYVTAHWNLINEWQGESAMCGWRLGMVDKTLPPAPGSIFTPQVSNIHSYIHATGEDATWRWSQPWEATFGNDKVSESFGLEVATAIKDYWTSIAGNFSNYLRFTSVKIAPILDTGKFAYPSAEYVLKTPLGGGASGNAQTPPEVAVATSIHANILGRRGRGRWYLPAPAMSTATMLDGKVLAAWRTTLAEAGRTLIAGLETAGGSSFVDFQPMVATASATSSTMVAPSTVRVGDHFDVQRRRQHQVEEQYTVVSLP